MRDDEILAALDTCIEYLRTPRPPPVTLDGGRVEGPSALYFHEGEVRFRVLDLRLIARRLLSGRHRVKDLQTETNRRFPDARRLTKFPRALQRRLVLETSARDELRFDLEVLFHIGAVLLDQWSFMASHLAGLNNRHTPFYALVEEELEKRALPAALAAIRERHRQVARWLTFWFRQYRNTFIVHTKSIVQRSHITGGIHGDVTLFIPAAVDRASDADVKAVFKLLRLAPAWLRHAPTDYWERVRHGALLARIVENIGNIEKRADRQVVASAANRVGLETPRSRVVLSVLARFVRDATSALVDGALLEPTRVVLGSTRVGT